jgi:hypothetical protein
MQRVVLLLLPLTLFAGLPAAALAESDLITVNFTVTGHDPADPVLLGVTASGSFSFESSIIPPSGGEVLDATVTSIDFTWDGVTWSDANAGLRLTFNPGGKITHWILGGDLNGIGSISAGDANQPNDFWIDSTVMQIVYHRYGTAGAFSGSLEYKVSRDKYKN